MLEIFFAIAEAGDVHGHQNCSRPQCIMESVKGSLSQVVINHKVYVCMYVCSEKAMISKVNQNIFMLE